MKIVLQKLKFFLDAVRIWSDNFKHRQVTAKLVNGRYYGTNIEIKTVDQLASPNKNLVSGYYQKISDKNAAHRFGTDDLNEYSFWAWRSCGIANVMSLLKSFNLFDGTLYELVKTANERAGYLHQDKWGRKDIGWKHRSLRDLLIDYGLNAKIRSHLSLNGLLKELVDEKIWIVSVKARGGMESSHLIIVSGVIWHLVDPELIIHDPYNLDNQGGNRKIKLSAFKMIFRNQGILVWKRKDD